ncbi:hypothetical protein FTUN_2419 [Frigoriglobus tundricola]|uniref:Uncharacterized protein n=1 Tax=Frigoriglobus tundricola TaxID=2774151 RepID=A0A6M5YNN4_9BACT|nr:hypothetical protein FTUN_2419 [Frigoriglobus tundricola]
MSEPPAAIPLPPTGGSTGSHVPNHPLSDLVLKGGSSHRPTAESDIAQFLAHPQGGAPNTDDAPTVITHNKAAGAPAPPAPVPGARRASRRRSPAAASGTSS